MYIEAMDSDIHADRTEGVGGLMKSCLPKSTQVRKFVRVKCVHITCFSNLPKIEIELLWCGDRNWFIGRFCFCIFDRSRNLPYFKFAPGQHNICKEPAGGITGSPGYR